METRTWADSGAGVRAGAAVRSLHLGCWGHVWPGRGRRGFSSMHTLVTPISASAQDVFYFFLAASAGTRAGEFALWCWTG